MKSMMHSAMDLFSVGEVPVQVHPTKADAGRAAAEVGIATIREAIARQGTARVIVGTANSQAEVVETLARAELPWKSIEVFHLDEYVGLPPEHPASFRRWLRERLVQRVSLRAVHYLNGDAADPDAEARRYAGLLERAPIDVAFIGFGENGHVAFNDPPVADFADPYAVKRVRLDERCRMQQVGEGHFPDLDAVPREALTLTIPTVMRVRTLVACVPERRKAEAVRDAIEGPLSTRCPASIVFTHPRASIFLDSDSASLLTRGAARA